MESADTSSPKVDDNKDPKSFWIVAVEADRIAMAVAIAGALCVAVLNRIGGTSSNMADVLLRSTITFVVLWVAVFALLGLLRNHFLRQLTAPAEVEELPDETPDATAAGEPLETQEEIHAPAHEDVA